MKRKRREDSRRAIPQLSTAGLILLLLTLLAAGRPAKCQAPRCYVTLARQDCIHCYGALRWLEQLKPELRPTICTGRMDRRSLRALRSKAPDDIPLRRHPRRYAALHGGKDSEVVLVRKGQVLQRLPLKALPERYVELNRHVPEKLKVIRRRICSDKIALPGFNHLTISDDLAALFNYPLQTLHLYDRQNSVYRQVSPDEPALDAIYRAARPSAGDSAVPKYLRQAAQMREAGLPFVQYPAVLPVGDTLWVLTQVYLPAGRKQAHAPGDSAEIWHYAWMLGLFRLQESRFAQWRPVDFGAHSGYFPAFSAMAQGQHPNELIIGLQHSQPNPSTCFIGVFRLEPMRVVLDSMVPSSIPATDSTGKGPVNYALRGSGPTFFFYPGGEIYSLARRNWLSEGIQPDSGYHFTAVRDLGDRILTAEMGAQAILWKSWTAKGKLLRRRRIALRQAPRAAPVLLGERLHYVDHKGRWVTVSVEEDGPD